MASAGRCSVRNVPCYECFASTAWLGHAAPAAVAADAESRGCAAAAAAAAVVASWLSEAAAAAAAAGGFVGYGASKIPKRRTASGRAVAFDSIIKFIIESQIKNATTRPDAIRQLRPTATSRTSPASEASATFWFHTRAPLNLKTQLHDQTASAGV